MDAGRWFFPVVRGHCRDLSCGMFRAAACRAARSGSRRIRRLSFLLQDPRPVLPGRPARLRQFGHYHRLLCRARFRFVLWRHSDGQVWLAVVFPRAWSPQLGLASALVPVDATRRKRAWWQSRRGKSWDYRNHETAVGLGHLGRSVWLGLFVLLLPYLDADLFGS